MKWFGFDDLDLIFKVTIGLKLSDLSTCKYSYINQCSVCIKDK